MQDALGRESALEQKLGMAQYGQQMAEAQNAALGAGLQQREALLQVCSCLQLVCSSVHATVTAEPAATSLSKASPGQAFRSLYACLSSGSN